MVDQSITNGPVAVTGSSGMVGSVLVKLLEADGRGVIPLRRAGNGWTPSLTPVEHLDASSWSIVHLAGEPIGSGRWTAAKKAAIFDSRAEGTRSLCQGLVRLPRPPKTLVCASAIGFYGNRGEELLDEESDPGIGFLPEVVKAWEQATEPAVKGGIRVVCLRFGMILSPSGGALARMLPLFRCGFGGRIGAGRQYWSWIALDDAVRAIRHTLDKDSCSGPVNVVSPQPVANAEFTDELASALRRPAVFHVPAWAVRMMLGQMADELLLASARVMPRRLLESGFSFQHTELRGALRHMFSPSL